MASKSCMSDGWFPPGTISPYSRRSDGLTSNKAGFLLTLDPKPWSLALVDDVQVFQAFLVENCSMTNQSEVLTANKQQQIMAQKETGALTKQQQRLLSSHAGWDVSCLMKGTSNAKSLLLLGLAHLCRLTAP